MHGSHDHHGHDHEHGHGHGHAHAPAGFDRAFAIGIGLNTFYVLVEIGVGLAVSSVALLADAGHNLSDVLGLLIAWGGAALARVEPSKRFTYGLKASTILAALLNALFLLVALGAIGLEAAERLQRPAPVPGGWVAGTAAVGIVVNLFTAWMFARGRHEDLNRKAAYLHMLSDALVSIGVVVAGLVIWWTGVTWIDPVISIAIAMLIFWQTWGLLRETVEMALGAVPRQIDFDAVEVALRMLPGVAATHDLHIWSMSTTETVLTAHLVMPAGPPGDHFLAEASTMLRERFRIGHATLQVEQVADCGQGVDRV